MEQEPFFWLLPIRYRPRKDRHTPSRWRRALRKVRSGHQGRIGRQARLLGCVSDRHSIRPKVTITITDTCKIFIINLSCTERYIADRPRHVRPGPVG